VSVVIPNLNGRTWLPGCLEALDNQEYRDFRTTVVDNGSTDGSAALVREGHPGVELICLERNQGFAAAVNTGTRSSRSEYVALLNTDTVARPSWLGTLVRTLDALPPGVGAVAPKMLRMADPDTVDDAGNALSWTGAAQKLGHRQPSSRFVELQEVFAVSGGASLYRRSFLEAMGGFDEAFFAYLEDVDLGLRGRLCGFRFVLEPAAQVLHEGYGSGIPRSSYVRLVTRNRLMLFAKSVPPALLLRNLGRLAYGQLYFLLAYRRPFPSLAGYAGFLRVLPHVLRERRTLKSRTRISPAELQRLLDVDTDEPPRLGDLLTRPLGSRGP
jgi:GT2 family glycosyltransferase